MENSIRNLMFDLSDRREIFDDEQNRVISTAEANDRLRTYCFETLHLNEKSTDRDIKRALDTPEGKKFFQVIEEILDKQIATGWHDNEFFNDFVEQRNLKDGDMNEFWTEEDIILNVAKVSGDHHDLRHNRIRVA